VAQAALAVWQAPVVPVEWQALAAMLVQVAKVVAGPMTP
jgi:hypothetical protein